MGFVLNLDLKAKKSIIRFPVVSTWTFFGSLFLIGIFAYQDGNLVKSYESLILVLVLGVSWLIGCQFLSETLKHNFLNRFVFKGVVILALGVFYYYLEQHGESLPDQAYQRWFLLLLAGHLFIIFSPFVFLWDKNLFWNYLKSILLALIRSSIYTIVLYIGLALAVSALEFLFDVGFSDNIFAQILIFCLGIVNTFVYLHGFPKVNDLKKSIDFSKAIEVLVLYILMPLSLLYLAIVYAYAFKILVEWELPRGWVTYLISGLSILGFIIHIGIEPVRHKHDSKLIQKFFPYYFYAVLPLLPLLFIALYKRIADYNFTELRYLGLVLAVWIVGMLLYMIISKKKPLSIYAKTMFILILLCTFGPLSAFKVSMNAQLYELEKLMGKLNEKTKRTFTAEEYERFSSIVEFLEQRQDLKKAEGFFGFNPEDEFLAASGYQLPQLITDKLNIEITKPNLQPKNLFLFYNLDAFDANFSEEISTYTNFTILKLEKVLNQDKALQLSYTAQSTISLSYYGETLMETNLDSHLKAMASKYDNLSKATQDEFTFRFKNTKGDFLIIFEALNYAIIDNQSDIKAGKAMVFYRTYEALELP